MRNPIFRIISAVAFMVAAMAGSSQAALRCELTMQSSVSKTSCIDPASLNGKTVTVPANVTRIGHDGLALCGLSHSSSQASDIAYVIDNSNSMDAWGFWVNPSTGDTSFYIPNCASSVSGTKVTFRKRHFGASGLDSSWDTLVKISSSTNPASVSSKNCLEANDPYSMRAEVVRVAMKYQQSLDSNSQAGMIQFSSKVQQRSPLRVLRGAGFAKLLDSTGLYGAASGTKWTPPMDTALGWLESSTNAVKAVIVVSDGEPDDGSAYRKLLRASAEVPKIYGIFLGSGISDVAEMDSLSAITGGTYWIVPPNRPDSLQSVIRSIVGNVMSTETPGTTVLTNLTNGQSSTALTITQGQDSVFHIKLDSVVALDTGKNSVRLVSSWTDDQGKARSDTSSFILNVSGVSATASGAIKGDTLFATACTDASRLSFLSTSNGKAIDTVSEGEGAFALELVTSDLLSFPTYVSVAERFGGDKESMPLTATKAVAGVTDAWANQLPLAVPRPWSHKSGDGIVQAANGVDTLVGSWCYPRDARDCAEDTLVVRALKSPYVEWMPQQVSGSSGSLVLEALLPGQVGATVDGIIYRGGKAIGSVKLQKVSDSLFRDTVNFRQGGLTTGGDSLWIANPTALDSLVAKVVWSPTDSVLYDTARVVRPVLSLAFAADPSDPQAVRVALSGGMADLRGEAAVFLSPSAEIVKLKPVGKTSWEGVAELSDLLPESLDSVLLKGFFVDPVYGDTAWAQIRVASPWYPGSLVVSPDTADPRRGDSVTIVVRDRDPDSTKAGTVSVTSGTLSWTLPETGRATGEYRLRLAASDLAPDWAARAPNKAWNVTLRYQDPLHAQDVVEDTLVLSFSVPPLQVAVHNPLVERPTTTASSGTIERSNGATGLVLVAQSDTVFHDDGASIGNEPVVQGIAIRTWEAAHFSVYIYDQLGVAVNSWAGQVLSSDASKGALYLLRWDGRDKAGEAAGAGVYLVRVVRYAADGRYLGNDVLKIGLR